MKDIIITTIYSIIFLIQITLLILSSKKKKRKLCILTYSLEIISIITTLILMIYYLQPNSYYKQTKYENLYTFIAFNIYSITFFITYIIGATRKLKQRKHS